MKTRSWEASATASINFASAAVRHAPRTSENIRGMVGPEVDIDAAPSPQTIDFPQRPAATSGWWW
jgi:hypothetical protein